MEKTVWYKRPWLWAVLLAFLHFFFAIAYASVTPYRTPGATNGFFLPDIGAPDERAHANNIRFIIETGQLPVMDPSAPGVRENYQSHQMPLYYWVNAKLAQVFGLADVETQAFGRFARTLNALSGAGAVAFVFASVWVMAGALRPAIGAAGFIALLPMNLFLSGAVTNDPFLIFFCSGSIFFLAKQMTLGWTWRESIWLGLFVGSAFMTKSHGLLLFPLVPLAWVLTPKERKGKVTSPLLAIALLSLVALPGVSHNVRNYNELLPQIVFTEVFPPNYGPERFESPLRVTRWLSALVDSTVDSSTGAFGYFDIHYEARIPDWVASVTLLLSAFGLCRLIKDCHSRFLIVSTVFVGLCVAGYLAFNMKYAQPQARYLFPALPCVAIAVGYGLLVFPRRSLEVGLAALLYLNITTLPWLDEQFKRRVTLGAEWIREGVAEERKLD
ncbi:MAG: phospholipid carrier-dependent glycosyltransferase [Fimbriimonadaceae bacterium]|nr:phospholipid carrier-dependent glycosyltransferase [Fimbriimonadaceae bacterium]